MAIKVGINGFGRIGRVALRIMVERGSATYQMCGINLRNADLDYMVYQVKYDSVFKTFQGTVERDDRHLIINGKKIRVYSCSDAYRRHAGILLRRRVDAPPSPALFGSLLRKGLPLRETRVRQ